MNKVDSQQLPLRASPRDGKPLTPMIELPNTQKSVWVATSEAWRRKPHFSYGNKLEYANMSQRVKLLLTRQWKDFKSFTLLKI